MKNYLINTLQRTIFNVVLLLFLTSIGYAQSTAENLANLKNDLPKIYLSEDVSLHFLSPEPIQYADISVNDIVGDIPVDNILRIKYFPDTSIANNTESGARSAVVTIAGQSFIAQYLVIHAGRIGKSNIRTSVEILPEHMRPLEFPEISLTDFEMKGFALDVLKRKRAFFNVAAKENGMLAWLNNIYAYGDYFFVDIGFYNRTRIKYDIDQFRFIIQDKRIVKATNVQEVEVKPVFSLYANPYFRKRYRNVFVFRKFTIPGDKVLNIRLSEQQVSGRSIELKIDYRDLLNADTL